jgi:tetratricopeptide (TPR) repeat protein
MLNSFSLSVPAGRCSMSHKKKPSGESPQSANPPILQPPDPGIKPPESTTAIQIGTAAQAGSAKPDPQEESIKGLLFGPKSIAIRVILQLLFASAMAVGTALGILQLVDKTLDYRIAQAVDTRVGNTLKDFETRTQALESENDISRKATECYSAMKEANCTSDPGSAIAAYEDFIRHNPIDTVPETLRNILFQQLLAAWMTGGKFESIRIQEVDKIAASFDRAPKRLCPSAYNNVGLCYLCRNHLDKARAYFLQAISILKSALGRDENEIEIAIGGLLLTSISDSQRNSVKDKVDSSIQTLDDCEIIIPVSYAQIHAKLVEYSNSQLLTYLRITNPSGFSESLPELLREMLRKDSIKDVAEDGIHYLRGTVKVNGKEVHINYQLSPIDMPKPGDRPRNGDKPRDMKKEELDRLKQGC